MYGKLLITLLIRHLAIFGTIFCCWLVNIFLTQFWAVKFLIHKPQPRRVSPVCGCWVYHRFSSQNKLFKIKLPLFFRNMECANAFGYNYLSDSFATFVRMVVTFPMLAGPSDYIALFMTFERFAHKSLTSLTFLGWEWCLLF